MNRKNARTITLIFGILAAVLSWISAFYVMGVVYDSLVGSILFATILSIIIFFESRFMTISLKIDGTVAIKREEISNNFAQLVLAISLAVLISIPLEMMALDQLNGSYGTDFNEKMSAVFSYSDGYLMLKSTILIVTIMIFITPIFIRFSTEE